MPTKIEWAKNPDGTQGETWNPVVGCEKVSPGCAHCYAESFARRQGVSSSYRPGEATIRCFPERLEKPLRWKKPRRVFVCSLADLWHEEVPDEFIDKVFAAMAVCDGRTSRLGHHTFMLLTKRPARMQNYVTDPDTSYRVAAEVCYQATGNWRPWKGGLDWRPEAVWPLPNVELGVSVENQHFADLRLPHLLATPAAGRFVSYEPALGFLDLFPYATTHLRCSHGNFAPEADSRCQPCGCWPDRALLDRVICGGESGPRARPMHPDWARGARDQCVAAGVQFVFKQWGRYAPVWSTKAGTIWVHPSGKTRGISDYRWQSTTEDEGWRPMTPLGKKLAGAVLDGREWPMQRPDGI